ncbi:MAG: kelch repeat-containing protein [Planctomycetota bacterium]
MRTPDTPRFPARTLRSLGTLLLIAGLVAACGGGGGGGGGGGTPVSPFVVATLSPADGANGVATNVHVLVTFSLPVAPSSVTASAVAVGNTENGGVAGTVGLVADGLGTTLEFSPSAPLAASKTYSIVVSAALRSTAGDALGGDRTFIFRTGTGGGAVLPPASALQPTSGRLQQGRRNHTATLLASGSVLVAGGFIQGTTITDRAETFSPGTQTFATITARMQHARAGHTATRLADGRVLLAGGYYEINPGTLNVTATAEVYDPADGSFTAVGSMGTPRADHAALRLPDGRVLVTGGSELQGAFLADHSSVEVFNPTTGQFTAWPVSMSHTRATHAMIDLLDGRWLLVAGSDTDLRPETFSTTTGQFTPFAAATPDRARFGAAAAAFPSGSVSVVGGEALGEVLYFDRGTTALINSGSGTSKPRSYGTATAIGPGRVLVAGGIDFSNGSFVLATCDLVVEGGVAGSETYATAVRFPTGMANHTATVLGDGRILFCGGLNPTGGLPEYDGAYLFTP